MVKKIMLLMLALFVTPVFAQTDCTEQYSGEYHCLDYETGQSTDIHITPYHGNTVQPLEMPDLSQLPDPFKDMFGGMTDPTALMAMGNSKVNDIFNQKLSFDPNVRLSPQAQQTLDNIAKQNQALAAEANRTAEQLLRQRQAEQANRQQAEFAQQQILLSQQIVQANQERLAQLEAQKRTNYIIAGLIALVSVLIFALGVVWLKNK